MFYWFNSIPEKINLECIRDKFGQRYAGIYVGECDISEECESRRSTLIAAGDTSRRTSQSGLGNNLYIHYPILYNMLY